MTHKVLLRKQALKQIERLPVHIALKLSAWRELVEKQGLEEARKIPGFHDEPLKEKRRQGQRSIRLSKGYRAFYRVMKGDRAYVLIEEVNKHDY